MDYSHLGVVVVEDTAGVTKEPQGPKTVEVRWWASTNV